MVEPGAIGWIREIVLDGTDPWALAEFWARLVGGEPLEWYDGSSGAPVRLVVGFCPR